MSQQDLGALQLKGAVEAIQNQRNEALDKLADSEGRVAMLTETLKTCTETLNKQTEEIEEYKKEIQRLNDAFTAQADAETKKKPQLKVAPTPPPTTEDE